MHVRSASVTALRPQMQQRSQAEERPYDGLTLDAGQPYARTASSTVSNLVAPQEMACLVAAELS